MKPKNTKATTKALQAWQSELRRLEKRLEEWSNQLAEREFTLEEQEEAFERAVGRLDDEKVKDYAEAIAGRRMEPFVDEDDEEEDIDEEGCGCTEADAKSGCECPTCAAWRKGWKARHQFQQTEGKTEQQGKKNDVKWLEDLWKLEDKRSD